MIEITKKGLKMQDFISAKECIDNFGKMGLEITESFFSKNKKKGYFRVHKLENSKRDWFIWDEVVRSYFAFSFPKDKREKEIRERYFKVAKIKKNIDLQWDQLSNIQELTFELFDIENLWIRAAENLKEIEEREARGEIIDDKVKDEALKEAAKTKEEHIEDFCYHLHTMNTLSGMINIITNTINRDLSEIYSDFGESEILLNILKSVNSYIDTPLEVAEFWKIDLIKGIDPTPLTPFKV